MILILRIHKHSNFALICLRDKNSIIYDTIYLSKQKLFTLLIQINIFVLIDFF